MWRGRETLDAMSIHNADGPKNEEKDLKKEETNQQTEILKLFWEILQKYWEINRNREIEETDQKSGKLL